MIEFPLFESDGLAKIKLTAKTMTNKNPAILNFIYPPLLRFSITFVLTQYLLNSKKYIILSFFLFVSDDNDIRCPLGERPHKLYSYLRLSAGFNKADFIVRNDTVTKATNNERTVHIIKTPAPMFVGYE